MREDSKLTKLLKKLNVIQVIDFPIVSYGYEGKIKYEERLRMNKHNPLSYLTILIYIILAPCLSFIMVLWSVLFEVINGRVFIYENRSN